MLKMELFGFPEIKALYKMKEKIFTEIGYHDEKTPQVSIAGSSNHKSLKVYKCIWQWSFHKPLCLLCLN